MRAFIIALSIFLWVILGWFYWQSSGECCGTDASDKSEISDAAATGAAGTGTETTDVSSSVDGAGSGIEAKAATHPLMYNWSGSKPTVGGDWNAYRDNLLKNMSSDDNVEITGLYRNEEKNESSYENLGMARANEAKSLISPPVDADKIVMKSKLIDDKASTGSPFVSVEFRRFIKKATIDESIANKTIIRFPPNSTNKLDNAEVEDYLDKVAERVKKSGERIRLTGHTDNIGGFNSNVRLSQRRADVIKNYLVSKGVSASNILTEAKGESSPVASNKADSGRSQNRRTELEIIK